MLIGPRDGKRVYASDGAGSAVHTFSVKDARLTEGASLALPRGAWPAGIAVSANGRRLLDSEPQIVAAASVA